MAAPEPLRLLAEDADDLEVISAALQDAVARIGDIQWERQGRRLTIAFNRFRWESPDGAGERVRAGLQLGGVLEVKARNLRPRRQGRGGRVAGADLRRRRAAGRRWSSPSPTAPIWRPRWSASTRPWPIFPRPGPRPASPSTRPRRRDRCAGSTPTFRGSTPTSTPFLAEPRGSPADVDAAVAAVIEAVRAEGLEAVLRFRRQFDGADLTAETLRVSPRGDRRRAPRPATAEVREALAFAAGRIRAYHERQRPADGGFTDDAGRRARLALDAAGGGGHLCAGRPGGLSLHGADERGPGQGRRRGPHRHGHAARAPGSRRCWPRPRRPASPRSGASAGPRRWRRWPSGPGRSGRWTRSSAPATPMSPRPSGGVYGVVGIDALAGPVGDRRGGRRRQRSGLDRRRPSVPGRARSGRPIDPDHRRRRPSPTTVAEAIERQLPTLATGEDAAASWRDHGAIVDRAAGPVAGPGRPDRARARGVRGGRPERPGRPRCGTPGPSSSAATPPRRSATMWPAPTTCCPPAGAARFSSGLSTLDFLKRTSIVGCDAAAFAGLAEATAVLAKAEGLPAHARSVDHPAPTAERQPLLARSDLRLKRGHVGRRLPSSAIG